jgi:RNA polymerase sigma factor (sigma-70 family)
MIPALCLQGRLFSGVVCDSGASGYQQVNIMNEDANLLSRYAAEGAEDAFTALVQRHINFVYGCALRRVGGDRQAAEDVAQRVFVALARSAGKLTDRPSLGGWLHTTTRNVAAQYVRGERRRRDRETAAGAMSALDAEPAPAWEQLAPLLDDALDAMNESDREAVLMRYFQGCSYAEIGGRLRLAENAARMRVDRALERLRGALERGGITSTAGGLALALTQHASMAAPAGLATATSAAALAGVTAGGGLLAFFGLAPVSAGLAGAVIVAGAGLYWKDQREQDRLRTEIAALQTATGALTALRTEHGLLSRAAAETESLRQVDAELQALSARVSEVRNAQAARDQQAEGEARARQAARRGELERWLREQDRLAQLEVERLNQEGNRLVQEYKEHTARSKNVELEPAERQSAETAARALMVPIQSKQTEIKAFVAAERSRLAGAQQELRSLAATLGEAAKGSGAFVFRRTLEGRSPPTPIESGQPGDAANAAAPGSGRLRLKP